MNNYRSLLLSITVLFTFTLSVTLAGGPDLVVKIVKDDLLNTKKCTLGVLKNGNFKDLTEKYKIIKVDFYVLNYRGETKWYKQLDRGEVDLSTYENLEIVKGDLIVLENITLVHNKSGEVSTINRITERYLVR